MDVERIADQAKAVGASYDILTLGQNQVYSCAPNPLIDALWKPDGSRTGPFLDIQPEQFTILEAVRDALKDLPPSDGSGRFRL